MAKALKPAVTSSYMASKKRRKSNKTLPPPILPDIVLNEFVIEGYYLAWLFSVAVRPSCDMRYTKLLKRVYGGNCPTNSSTE